MITPLVAALSVSVLGQVGGLDLNVKVKPPVPGEVASSIAADRLKASVEKLASFGTRHTLSETESDVRGIGAARRWLKSELESYGGGLRVSFEEFDVPPSQRLPDGARVANVVAVLEGTDPRAKSRVYYVVGHYDSRNDEPLDAKGAAPGANDDASGTAAVLEIARVLAKRPLESTVVFLCTGAEEQGLLGARYHADRAASEKLNVMGVLSNDIIGDPYGWSERSELGPLSPRWRVRVFSEGVPRNPDATELARIRTTSAENDSTSRQLARYVVEVAEWEDMKLKPKMVLRQDRFLRGGDHSAFNDRGFPAVRFTVPVEDYTRQHVGVTEKNGKPYGDLPEFVDAGYLTDVTRLNAAALVHMANAPSPPARARVVTAILSPDTLIRWDASPESDVAGYEVVWRETTSAVWTHSRDVGDVVEFRSELSKDDVFFGVRAYDKSGYRSPVSFCGAAAE